MQKHVLERCKELKHWLILVPSSMLNTFSMMLIRIWPDLKCNFSFSDLEKIKSYIDSFRFGAPPHAGGGIGNVAYIHYIIFSLWSVFT